MSQYGGSMGRGREMRYMYDMYGRPLLDVYGRPMTYGQPRAPTPQLGAEEPQGKKRREPPARTSFRGRKVSPLAWSALVVAFLAFMWTILSFGIPLWATTLERDTNIGDMTVGYGLWHHCSRSIKPHNNAQCRYCSWEQCRSITTLENDNNKRDAVPGWFPGCRAMAVMALAGILTALLLIIFYIFIIQCNRKTMPMVISLIASFAAGLIQTGLVIMWGILFLKNVWWERNMHNYHLSWCFGLGIAAAVFDATTAVVLAFELRELVTWVYN